MSYFRNAVRCVVMVLGMASALWLAGGCTTLGKIGVVSKFDITKASEEDIAEALKKDGRVVISGGILFETDSAKLEPSAAYLVGRLSDVMNKNPDLKVAVVGYTDNTGDFKYNLQLSQRRAKSLVDALIAGGAAENRLAAVGLGPLNPVATNDTAEGRAQNRRVELVLIR